MSPSFTLNSPIEMRKAKDKEHSMEHKQLMLVAPENRRYIRRGAGLACMGQSEQW